MSDGGNLYQRLVLLALAKLEADGTLPSSIAELAQSADITTEVARSIFATPEALREGLIYHGVILLNDELRRGVVASGSDSPDDQLRCLARSYSEWAGRNSALFRLFVEGLSQPMSENSTLYRFSMSMRDLFERKLNEMREIGLMRADTDLAPIMLVIHCVMKGANAIFMTREHDPWIKDDPRSTPRMATEMFDYFIDCMIVVNAPRAA